MVKMTREQLGVQPGDSIVIKGTVSFARLDKLVEGEALASENARRKGLGMMAADKPFRSITIENPEIVQGGGTPLAQFHGQNVYTSGAGKPSMSLESKSLFAPKYGQIQNGTLVEIADPQKNPAPGQEVFLMIEAFGSKSMANAKLGSSFNAIAFPEGEIKFYEGATGGGGLSGFGQALNLPVQNLSGNAQAPAQTPVFGQQAETAAPAQNNGFGSQPVQQPAAPAQDNGFGQAEPSAPAQDANPFNGFGQQPAQTAGRSNNPFA